MNKILQRDVSLMVGVTGHRDLLDTELDVIGTQIRSFFLSLRESYPELPLMVITPLAEGADRLAAQVAHELDIPTVVLLPMSRHLYETDFEGKSRAQFEDMLEFADEVIELPLGPDVTEADVAQHGSARNVQYARLGAYLAAHSHILLAIWDGKPSEAPGGTGHVINFHQHDIIDLISAGQHRSPIDFTEDESDLVYHVVCSRRDAGSPADGLVPGQATWFTRDEAEPRTELMPQRYRLVFKRMADFSADLERYAEPEGGVHLLSEASLADCGQGARDIEALYQRADHLARHYQRRFLAGLRWTTGFALAAGFSFVAFADLPDLGFMILPYIGALLLVVGLTSLDSRRGWHRKYLDYRVLAEGLRVQFYWSVAGVPMDNPSRFPHDSFLRRQDLELGWIRNVMRFAAYRADARRDEPSSARLREVVDVWVVGQLDYYWNKMRERGERHRVTGAIVAASFVIVLVLAFALSIMQALDQMLGSDILIAVMGLLPFVVAARQNYAWRIAERELVAQYQHTTRILSNAKKRLEQAKSVELEKEILRAMGEAALEENGQWILRQRERPLSSSVIQG